MAKLLLPSCTHQCIKELLQQSIDDLNLLHNTGLACTAFRRSILNALFIIETVHHIISEPLVHFLELPSAELVHWLSFFFI